MNALPLEETTKARAAHKDGKLTGLEAGRGVAALLVLLRHAWAHCRLAYGDFPLGKIFTAGHLGVDFFFVLSGFIIFHAHRGDIGRPGQLGRYIERRTTRIYPIYWVVLALAILGVKAGGHPWPAGYDLVSSFTLWPAPDQSMILPVAWTLQQEVIFYALFATIILNRTLGQVVFAAWLALLIYVNAFDVTFSSSVPAKFALYFNFEFFLGIFAAWYTARATVPVPKIVLLAGVLAFMAIGYGEDIKFINNLNVWTHIGYGTAAMLTVIGLVGWERQGRFTVPRPLMALGGASYSLYLTHILSIGLVWQVAVHFGIDKKLSGIEAYIILVSLAVLVGVVVSKTAEKPLMALIRRWLGVAKAGLGSRSLPRAA